DVTAAFGKDASGKYTLAVRGHNSDGPAGLLVRLIFEAKGKEPFVVVSDESWRVFDKKVDNWIGRDFDDKDWKSATVVGQLGDQPWSDINEATLTAAPAAGKAPSATPAETLKLAKGFKAELLYSVPKDVQGSWVNMTV